MQSLVRILCFILVLISASLKAQRLYENKFNGPYVLLYKLTPEQMTFLASHPQKIDSQFLYTNLVGKVSSDSIFPLHKKPVDDFPIHPFYDEIKYRKCFPKFHIWDIKQNGYFIEVTVNSLFSVNYRLIENPLFNAGVFKIGYETFIFVEDTAGLPVYDAEVLLRQKLCLFDSSVGGYKIGNDSISGLLKITRANQFTLTSINGQLDKSNNSTPPRDHYRYSKIRYQGYLVTNKPTYKHWDTVFFKSFFVNAKGKPIKEKLTVRLYQNASGYSKQLIIKPKERGAYFGYFVISDSLYLDQDLTVSVQNRRGVVIKYQTIRLENYELKDIFFEIKADKQLVTPGAGIQFYVSATTANRLPIMDGKLNFKMRLSNVNFTDGDSVVIPFQKYNNWYNSSVQTDPSGVTIFEIPDSVFMALEGKFLATCTLLTSDNESREVSLYFDYQTTRDRQEARLIKDTLKVLRLYNMKSVRRKMHIKIYSRKDLLADSVIYTPINLYLPPNVYTVQIFKGDTLTGTFYRQTQLPEVWGKRTHDSMNIHFKSSFDIPVFYRIYCNNKLVSSGNKTELSWQIKDKSKNSYHIQYGILEGAVITPRFYSKSFHLAEKELRVKIIQPTIIYPGQQVAIEVAITNAYGKPVNKVNLAAWAVNTQLDNIITPDIPYLGLVKTQKPLPTKNWPLLPFQTQYQSNIKDYQLNTFYLLKNDIFKLAYPNKGFMVITDTTPRHSTEIEFYAHGMRMRQEIAFVKANDTLLYSIKTSPMPDVYRIKPGKYDFQIRTFDRLYTFKNVNIIEGKKNFVCLQLDSLKKYNLGDSMALGILDSMEMEMFFNHTLLFKLDRYLNDTFIIKVNGKIRHSYQGNQYSLNQSHKISIVTPLYNQGQPSKKQISTQAYLLFGSLQSGDLIELFWKNNYSHLITFIPGNSHSFTAKDQVTEFNRNWMTGIQFLQLQSNQAYKFDNFWWDPEFKDTIKKIKPIIPPAPPYYQTGNLVEFQYSNYAHPNNAPFVYNTLLNFYMANVYQVKRMWLFERDDSTYSILQNNYIFDHSYPQIGMNAKRNLWTFTPTKKFQNFRLVIEINDTTWFVKNIKIDSSVHLFLTLKSSQFRKLGKAEHLFYDRLVKNLTRQPLIEFKDTPTFNKGLFVIPLKNTNEKTSIEGSVIGPGIKYPVNNAFVVLEKNGLYERGAITNREGRFVMDNLQPGIYMLKIKSDQYNYWVHYKLELTKGYTHLVQAQMKPYAWLKYNQEVYNAEEEAVYSTSDLSYNAYKGNMIPSSKDIMYAPQRAMGAISTTSSGLFKSDNRISFKGSRDDVAQESIEKVVLTGGKFKSINKKELSMADSENDNIGYQMDSTGWSDDDKKLEEERLGQLAGDKNAKRTRKDFRDYAFWIPNLYTNKLGKASFVVKYPDNVTSWKTFVPAMDGHRHSGLGEITVKSYKPITSSLAMPLFLTEGDTMMAYGRVMNYTGTAQAGTYFLKYNQLNNSKKINIKDYYNDSLLIMANKAGDSLLVEAGFEMDNGYRDAILRSLVVNPVTVISGKSMFMEIKSDTSLSFKALDSDLGMDVVVYNQKLALIMEMIHQIENLAAYDNRSLAAYLNALLIKKKICEALKINFDGEKQIRQTMGKIKKSQKDNGLFGWFKGSQASFVVSAYVAEVMFAAHQLGYGNNTWLNAARCFEKNMKAAASHEKLEYLLALKNMNRTFLYDTFIKTINPNLLDQSEKLAYWRLQQLLGKKIPLDQINALIKTTPEGHLKVDGTWNWKYAPITDDAANTYNAWKILFDANVTKERRKALVEYLATECSSYNNSWIKAAEAMLAEAIRDSALVKDFKPMVTVNGEAIAPEKLPVKMHLKPGESLTIQHKGSPVYVAANRKFKTLNPISDATQFAMDVSINGLISGQLKAGIPVEMKVTVFSKRHQYNTIIEVPIPAGSVYGSKIQGESGVESHREYQTDRVLIFSDELPFGYHTFTIRLVPRFTGTFYTAPARSALMFYPDKAAFTAKKRWTIGN